MATIKIKVQKTDAKILNQVVTVAFDGIDVRSTTSP